MRKLTLTAVLALVVVACAGDSDDTTTTADVAETPTTQAAPDTTSAPDTTGAADTTIATATTQQAADGEVVTVETDLGTVLADDDGLTLYIFGVDADGESSCYDTCEATWPVVPATLEADGTLGLELGSHTRTDGSEQLLINGRPVYLYAGDSVTGDTNGQGVGDVWFALDAEGEPITG